MIMRKGYRYRIKTNPDMEHVFRVYAGHCRYVWNKALAMQKDRLDRKAPVIRYNDMAGFMKLWKKSDEHGFLKEAHSQVLQQTLKDLDRALWDGLEKRKGMPRYRKKGLHDSFRFPQGFEIMDKRIYLPKIGWVGIFKSRDIEGTPKNVTVSRRGIHWYVSIQTEREVSEPRHPSTLVTGIDMGVKRFITMSDGSHIEPLNSFRTMESKLAREQMKLSRKKLYSNNWHKQKERITSLHIRIADARNDYLHKASTAISKNHATVVMEDLRVRNMSASVKGTVDEPGRNVRQKSGLNKSILDQGWYAFRIMLGYKLDHLGGKLILVPPHHTSQTCPSCGHVSKCNRLTQKEFRCLACGLEGHSDHVGAINILTRAGLRPASLWSSAPVGVFSAGTCGEGQPVTTPGRGESLHQESPSFR